MDKNSKGALDGVKILDLTRVLAGPVCTMMLADMGADVIKIEIPGKGDDSRAFSPFQNGESAYFLNLNRNKKGITLNMKSEKGKKVFLAMVKKADMVVENFRPGVMERLGFGYEDLKKVNPGIIYGAVSGFGHTGPYSQRPGYDAIGQAMSGLMSTTGWPETGETRVGTPMADYLAGLSATVALLAALHHREKTGEGQKIDIALMDAGIASMQVIQTYYLVEGRLPSRIGNRYESNYPTDGFPTKDGQIMVSAANDKLWRAMCKVMERADLAESEKTLTNKDRLANWPWIREEIIKWSGERTTKEAVDALLKGGVPAAPINSIAQVVHDLHTKAREMFVETEHPKAGKITVTGSQLKLSGTPVTFRTPAPALGQDNVAVYGGWLGMAEEEITAYKNEGVF